MSADRLPDRPVERLAAVLASVRDAVVTADEAGTIVFFNPAAERMFRCSAAEAIGTPLGRFVPGPFRAAHERAMRGFGAGEVTPRAMGLQRTVAAVRADGEQFEAEASIAHVGEAGARLFTAVMRDVTERVEAERRLRELNETLEQRVHHRTEALLHTIAELETLTHTIAHDLRAPLRAIDGYTQMVVEDEAALGVEARERLGEVRANAQWMGRLIDGLLAYARLARFAPTAERVDVAALAGEVAAALRESGGLGRAEVAVGALPAVLADREGLRRVLEALIGNAAKFSAGAPRPRVELAGEAAGGEARLTVRDNGAGFDMRFAHKLFGLFQRLHHRDEFEGAGVGLAVARRILEAHGGRIEAWSAPGQGAAFHFTLPLAAGVP